MTDAGRATSLLARVGWSVVLAVAAAVAVLLLAGWRPVVLLSDSMAPAAPQGALLITQRVSPDEVRVGDVITVRREDGATLTHRVVAVETLDGERWARLRGDANDLPDPGRVRLERGTLRTVAVVPRVGRVVAGGNPLLLAGLALTAIGLAGRAYLDRGEASRPAAAPAGPAEARASVRSAAPTAGATAEAPRDRPVSSDPRAVALAATLEALEEEGTSAEDLRAIAQVRAGALCGAGDVEDAAETAGLDDGARFVLVAYADVDPDALALVPTTSRRARHARAAVEAWWGRVGDHVGPSVRAEMAPFLGQSGEATAHRGGTEDRAPVD